jgi:hypothetical protein
MRRDALQRFMAVYDAAGRKDLDRAHVVQDRLKELEAEYVARLAAIDVPEKRVWTFIVDPIDHPQVKRIRLCATCAQGAVGMLQPPRRVRQRRSSLPQVSPTLCQPPR